MSWRTEKQIVYDKRVLLRNWYEEAYLNEEKVRSFLLAKESGKLLLAKYRKLKENLLKPVEITRTTGLVFFGSKIMLKATRILGGLPDKEKKKGMYLSALVKIDELEKKQDIEEGCCMSASSDDNSYARNTFIIRSADGCDRDGVSLAYGQDFNLQMAATAARPKPLYLRFDVDPIPGISNKFPLFLTNSRVNSTRWRVLSLSNSALTRFEMQGKPVIPNTDVVINHCASNLNMAINQGYWFNSFFGVECPVTVKNILDCHKFETEPNIWSINTQVEDTDAKITTELVCD